MGVQDGAAKQNNGNGDPLILFWRYRIGAFKLFVCFLFASNLFYFAVRFIELTNTVQKLEHEKLLLHQEINKQSTRQLEEKDKKISDPDEEPQLIYSQVNS